MYARRGAPRRTSSPTARATLFEHDAEISRYYNTELAGGKWSHMMDQTHIGYTYWQEPPRNVMPRVDVIQLPAAAEMGVAVVEQNRAGAAVARRAARRSAAGLPRDRAADVRHLSAADVSTSTSTIAGDTPFDVLGDGGVAVGRRHAGARHGRRRSSDSR